MNILLIGDNCIDEYYYGKVERISPEAPIPILNFTSREEKHGMAANVYENFKALGVSPTFITSGHSYKTRYIDIKTKQHLLRVDKDFERDPVEVNIDVNMFDCIVVSDYDKGTVTYDEIIKLCEKFKGQVFIDTKKKDLKRFDYSNCILKINELEYRSAVTLPTTSKIIVTCGKKGVFFQDEIYPSPAVDVFDICGAGDTFLSALVFQYLKTNDIKKSICFANAASAVTVRHSGVYAPSQQEVEEFL